MSKRVAVLIRDRERQYEGLRTALGLLLEDHEVSMFVLDHEVDTAEAYQENVELLDEMDGKRYSNAPVNVERHGFAPTNLSEVAAMLRDNDLVIPY